MAAYQSPKLLVGVRVPAGMPNKLIVMRKEDTIYKVRYTDAHGNMFEREFDNLTPAMEWAKTLSEFVTITGGGYDIDGSPSKVMTTQFETCTVISDGTQWWLIVQ